ncbi:MAG: MMPL family transporter, partial [Acidobacteriaceae bacterium]|nr:MMPL family transporter [Acidobacteriaceae bacterium]
MLALGLNLVAPFWRADSSADDHPPRSAAAATLDSKFPGTGTEHVVYVVFESARPLSADVHLAMGELAERLGGDTGSVRSVSDMSADPLTAPIAQSPNNTVAYIQAWLTGTAGSQQGRKSLDAVRRATQQLPALPGVRTYITGPAAEATDARTGRLPWFLSAVVTAMVILVLAATRSLVYTTIVLSIALLALIIALPVQNLAGQRWTGSDVGLALTLTIALTVGAALHYFRIFFGCYNRLLRGGHQHDPALAQTCQSLMPRIAASSSIVAATFCAARIPDLAELREIGVAPGIGVLVAMLLVFSLAPAWTRLPAQLRSRRARSSAYRFWGYVFRQPWSALACTTAVLIGGLLATQAFNLGFGETPTHGTHEGRGDAVIANSFGDNRLSPKTVLIESDVDLRNPAGLIAIERVTRKL